MFKSIIRTVVAGLLVFAMATPLVGAYATQSTAATNDSEVEGVVPTGFISEISADVSSTTVTISLTSSSWTEVYNNNNWTDVSVLLTNNTGNPGSVKFRILAKNKSTDTPVEIFASPNVGTGLSWTSGLVASSYNRYYVEAKAASTAGDYSITYDDI